MLPVFGVVFQVKHICEPEKIWQSDKHQRPHIDWWKCDFVLNSICHLPQELLENHSLCLFSSQSWKGTFGMRGWSKAERRDWFIFGLLSTITASGVHVHVPIASCTCRKAESFHVFSLRNLSLQISSYRNIFLLRMEEDPRKEGEERKKTESFQSFAVFQHFQKFGSQCHAMLVSPHQLMPESENIAE